MIEHFVFNCQSSRADAWDASGKKLGARRGSMELGARRWEMGVGSKELGAWRSEVSGQSPDHRTLRKSSIVICAWRRMLCNVFGAMEAWFGTVTRRPDFGRRTCEPT